MGQKLPPRELELYKRCDEVLHYLWDPIGVAGAPGARDEYDAYLPQVFRLICDRAAPASIVEYLIAVAQDRMGVNADVQQTHIAVNALVAWREALYQDAD